MNHNRNIYILILFVLLLPHYVHAYTGENENYKVELGFVEGITAKSNNTNYKVETTLYTLIANQSNSTNYLACIGFYCFWKETTVISQVIPVGGGQRDCNPGEYVIKLTNGNILCADGQTMMRLGLPLTEKAYTISPLELGNLILKHRIKYLIPGLILLIVIIYLMIRRRKKKDEV